MSKNIIIIIVGTVLIAAVAWFMVQQQTSSRSNSNESSSVETTSETGNTKQEAITVVAEGLDTPWSIGFLPDKSMLIAERQGTVRKIDSEGNLLEQPVTSIENVLEIGEGGLLGMTLHPDFQDNRYIYFYYTYSGEGNNTRNRVVRMKYDTNTFGEQEIILDAIPGASNHNGGRIKFGSDKNLYITTGDAQEPSQSQNTQSLAGKILRVTDEGKPVPNNPFDNEVYSYGHRNAQGLAWDEQGNLWSTEHGRSGIQSGFDEVNQIQSGVNYGWPEIQGDETKEGMQVPVAHSGSSTTWAPASAAYANGSLFFGGLRGRALYEAVIENNQVTEVREHVKNEYGRIREVTVGPDGAIYFATSNQDGRGNPTEGDDKIVRVDPQSL